MALFTPGTGIIHSTTFKYASILLGTTLYAESEVFTLDTKNANKLYRTARGLYLLFGIAVVCEDPNINLTVGHELGHNALDRLSLNVTAGADIAVEVLCDVCGLEYWMTGNQVALDNSTFKKLLSSEVKHVKSTWLDVGAERSEMVKRAKRCRTTLIRAWEWLQYAMRLEQEGKIPEFKPVENQTERKKRLEALDGVVEEFFKEKTNNY